MAMQENLYIIIDHSDSMKGQGIGSANDIAANIALHFRNQPPLLQEVSKSSVSATMPS